MEKTENSIKLRVRGGSQSVLNLLKEEADSVDGVSFAGFIIEHPLEKSSVFVIRTSSGSAEKALKKTLDKTQDDLKAAEKQILGIF